MRIDITEKNMVWLVEHKMADTIVAEFHRKEAVIESLIRERDEARAELATLRVERMQDETGKRITYADYERLRTENARLRASSFLTAVPVEDYEKLKAKVERLRKAGDAMANWFCPVAGVKQVEAHIAYDAWNAAKEGKPSV